MRSGCNGVCWHRDFPKLVTVDTYGTVIITQDQINRVEKQIRAA